MPTETPTELTPIHDETLKCNRCGFCQATCPVYRATGVERSVARGHHAHVRDIVEGRLELTRDLQPALFECLLCRACVVNCFPQAKTDAVMLAARRMYVERFGLPRELRFAFRYLLQRPERMARFLKLAFLGKRSGLAAVADRLRILPWLNADLAHANALMKKVPAQFFRDRIPSLRLRGDKATRRVGYFVGCGFNFALPHVAEATVEALVAGGCEVVPLDNCCCGLPPHVYGDEEAARMLIRRNLDTFADAEVDCIVADCGSCFSFLSDYPKLIDDDRAAALAAKVRELSSFLIETGVTAGRHLDASVTYHDPCHLSRYQNVTKPPRELLKSIDGVDFRELPEADWCCGSAGTYNIFHYEQSMEVLRRKMYNVGKTDARILATSCPACLIQLAHGARQHDVKVDVLHVAEVVKRAGQQGDPE